MKTLNEILNTKDISTLNPTERFKYEFYTKKLNESNLTENIEQACSSKNTSRNKNELPISSKYIDFTKYENGVGLDYGAGKYDNFIEFLDEKYNIKLWAYDKFNRSESENNTSLSQPKFDFVMCNNVLNVIAEDEIIREIVKFITSKKCDAYYLMYEGDKSETGKVTKKDCYQRNEKVESYLKFIPTESYSKVYIKKNMIVCEI